jgi:hypothetical protein
MLRVGSEPMIPVFERAKAVHALDRAATAIGAENNLHRQINQSQFLLMHSVGTILGPCACSLCACSVPELGFRGYTLILCCRRSPPVHEDWNSGTFLTREHSKWRADLRFWQQEDKLTTSRRIKGFINKEWRVTLTRAQHILNTPKRFLS